MGIRSSKIVCCSCFFLMLIKAGEAQMVDSIRFYTQRDPSFLVEFDTRHSFISGRPGKIFGLKFGLEHGDRVSYGGGINWLTNTPAHRRELGFGDTTVDGSLSFWFLSPFFKYTFYESPRWRLSMPVRIGVGRASFTYYDPEQQKQQERKRWVFNYEPMMTVQWKFWRYLGLSGGIGYRIIILDRKLIPERFNSSPYRFSSPTYALGLNFFFGKLFRDIFPKKNEKIMQRAK